MSSWAKPGVKCVCVASDDLVWGYNGAEDEVPGPSYGEICMVRQVNGSRIQLEGYWPEDQGYPISDFRPTITKTQEQDVAMLKSLLTDIDVSEQV